MNGGCAACKQSDSKECRNDETLHAKSPSGSNRRKLGQAALPADESGQVKVPFAGRNYSESEFLRPSSKKLLRPDDGHTKRDNLTGRSRLVSREVPARPAVW
jgi:hypothetical protein